MIPAVKDTISKTLRKLPLNSVDTKNWEDGLLLLHFELNNTEETSKKALSAGVIEQFILPQFT